VVILRSRVLPRALGAAGLLVSALYLLNQGDVLATAVPGFPVWDLAGLVGSTSWGLWVAALGVAVVRGSGCAALQGRAAIPGAVDMAVPQPSGA
jgi:hypothetical protein